MDTKGKILIVDDAELNRSVLADILDEKYEIIEAENGLEAIVQIEKTSTRESSCLFFKFVQSPQGRFLLR